MRKKLFIILSLLACMGMATAAEQFTVGEINIAPGGQATMTVNFKFDKADNPSLWHQRRHQIRRFVADYPWQQPRRFHGAFVKL